MDFDVWASGRTDPLRRRRLIVGSFLGVAVVAGMLAIGFSTSPRVAIDREEPPLEVELLAAEEEEEAPEPEEEPVAPVDPNPQAMAAVPRAPPRIDSPTEVPLEPAPEADAPDGPTGGGDPFARSGSGSGQGSGVGPAAPPPAPPPPPPPAAPPPPKKKAPVRISEDMTPPKAIAQGAPSYPAAAKAAGVEGTVVVKYVISESGRVTAASVVRGPQELAAACLAAVKTWTFEPARDASGRPVAVHRVARFPFRITT